MPKKTEKKQEYYKPSLKKYGDITKLTLGPNGFGGDKDSGSG